MRATGTSAKKKRADSASRVAAKRRSGLMVRMYRVGFGDFFLLTVPSPKGKQYILIDCGVFSGTTGKGDIGSILEAVEDLYVTTKGELALVIMTHRHADHIAGFSRSPRFKDFKVGMVWMPYWEQFNDAPGSPGELQNDIQQLAFQLAGQFHGRTDDAARSAFDLLANATGIDFNSAAAGGKDRTGNAAALDILKNQFGDGGRKVRYYAAGDVPELPAALSGLSATILGPPPKGAKAFLQLTDFKKNVGQYLDSATPDGLGARPVRPFPFQWFATPKRDYPQQDALGYPIDYETCRCGVDSAQPDVLVAAAEKIDTFLNNQSLVVLFQFAGKKLLFVGDAQAGNWEHWLYRTDTPTKDPSQAGEMPEAVRKTLETVDFYKVGHHGSTNATPIPVVQAFASGHSANGFVAMCSTQVGVYGNEKTGTEVPRNPLMRALDSECALVRSDSFDIIKSTGRERAATGSRPLPTPRAGTLSKGKLYVEYSF